MEKNRITQLLNEALQREYSDIFLYPRQAEIIKIKEISKKFEKFGRMELRHVDNIAMQIFVLGGKPNWEFTPLDTKESLNEMLLGHIEREAMVIQLYTKLIELADEEGEDQLKLILKGIKSEEALHLSYVRDVMKRNKE